MLAEEHGPRDLDAGGGEPGAERSEGRQAEQPQDIPGKGWRSVLLRTQQQLKQDNVTILAAGVAFYLMLALAPATVAVLSVYGFVAEPSDIADHIDSLGGALPTEVRSLVTAQMRTAGVASESELGIGLIVGLGAAVIGASKGARSLIETINVAFDEEETRGFVKVRPTSPSP